MTVEIFRQTTIVISWSCFEWIYEGIQGYSKLFSGTEPSVIKSKSALCWWWLDGAGVKSCGRNVQRTDWLDRIDGLWETPMCSQRPTDGLGQNINLRLNWARNATHWIVQWPVGSVEKIDEWRENDFEFHFGGIGCFQGGHWGHQHHISSPLSP